MALESTSYKLSELPLTMTMTGSLRDVTVRADNHMITDASLGNSITIVK